MIFKVTDSDRKIITEWLHETIFPAVIERQKKEFSNINPIIEDCWDEGYPYEGAIGGGLTYHFTPTGIGVVFKVTYDVYELDLTDYDSW